MKCLPPPAWGLGNTNCSGTPSSHPSPRGRAQPPSPTMAFENLPVGGKKPTKINQNRQERSLRGIPATPTPGRGAGRPGLEAAASPPPSRPPEGGLCPRTAAPEEPGALTAHTRSSRPCRGPGRARPARATSGAAGQGRARRPALAGASGRRRPRG